jgi:hypothetical protein
LWGWDRLDHCVPGGDPVLVAPATVFLMAAIKAQNVVRNYYVLPCCLLLLNLCIELVSYKAKMIDDVLLRTGAIMGMVLFGGALVGFVAAPAIATIVGSLHRSSRARFGGLGEAFFLLVLGGIVFWLYYRVYILGPESVLPMEWWNPRRH